MDMTLLRPSTLKDISILSSGRSIGTTAGYDGFERARMTRSAISSISPVAPSKAAMIKDVMVRLDGTSADDVRLAAANLIAETFESHITGLFFNVLPSTVLDGAGVNQATRLLDRAREAGDVIEATVFERLTRLQ
jgi:hypothetical protein